MGKTALFVIGCGLLIGGIWIGRSNSFPTIKLTRNVEDDLSSKEGLMKLIPQLRNASGNFQIPDPTHDLEKFLTVRQALINIIESALAQANTKANPYAFAYKSYTPLTLPKHWRAAEVGFVTDAKTVPDFSNGGFGYFGGKSFLDGVIPVAGTNDSFYTVPGSAVYMNLMPTSIACVNRIMETSGMNGGTMLATSYVLGKKNGKAYLIVNGCQNTAKTVQVGDQQLLAPGASSFLGMQWAEEE
jgi:hypothetical protein